jgi:hypothetical protein
MKTNNRESCLEAITRGFRRNGTNIILASTFAISGALVYLASTLPSDDELIASRHATQQTEQTQKQNPSSSHYEFFDLDNDGVFDAYRSRFTSTTPGSIEGRTYFRPGFGPGRGGGEGIGLGYDWCDSTYIQELARREMK